MMMPAIQNNMPLQSVYPTSAFIRPQEPTYHTWRELPQPLWSDVEHRTLPLAVKIFIGGMRYDTNAERVAQLATCLSGTVVSVDNVVVFPRDPERKHNDNSNNSKQNRSVSSSANPAECYSGTAILHLPVCEGTDRLLSSHRRVLLEESGFVVFPNEDSASHYSVRRGSGPHPLVVERAKERYTPQQKQQQHGRSSVPMTTRAETSPPQQSLQTPFSYPPAMMPMMMMPMMMMPWYPTPAPCMYYDMQQQQQMFSTCKTPPQQQPATPTNSKPMSTTVPMPSYVSILH
eukprot:PhM_4_TR10083/c0_g1_i1/m.75713